MLNQDRDPEKANKKKRKHTKKRLTNKRRNPKNKGK